MNVIDSAQLTEATVNLCHDAMESIPRSDLGETLTLVLAATICCIKCNEEGRASEGLLEEKDINFSGISINKKLTILTFLLYQALYYLDIDCENYAAECMIEGLGLFGIPAKKIIDLSNEVSSQDMIYPLSREFIDKQKIHLSKGIIND